MSLTIWIIIGSIFVIIWSLIAYEVYNTPITPDNIEEDTKISKKQQQLKNKK